jgi:hypothetical protein
MTRLDKSLAAEVVRIHRLYFRTVGKIPTLASHSDVENFVKLVGNSGTYVISLAILGENPRSTCGQPSDMIKIEKSRTLAAGVGKLKQGTGMNPNKPFWDVSQLD